jgi:hypothetical protein
MPLKPGLKTAARPKRLPQKKARTIRYVKFTNCNWPVCGCQRDPEGAPYFNKRRWEGRRLVEDRCVPWADLVDTSNGLARERDERAKNANLLPKKPVGSLHLEFKKCGRQNCRCRRGLLHGPYVYRHRRENGRQKKEYVPMRRLSEVALEMERQRSEVPRPGQIRRALKGLENV